MTCDPSLIDRYLAGTLTPAEEEALEAHMAECEACRARFDELTRPVTEAVRGAASALAFPQRLRRRLPIPGGTARRPRFWIAAALAAALLVGAFAVGSRYAQQWLFVIPEAPTQDPDKAVQSLQNEGFEQGEVGWTGFGGLNATVDTGVAHSGRASAKLLHRSGGGRIDRVIPIPVPAGSDLTLSAWVLCPRGGSTHNKWLALSVAAGDDIEGVVATLDIYDASPHWRPIQLHLHCPIATNEIRVEATTSPGRGNYEDTDWASWVDDFGLSLVLRGQAVAPARIDGDAIRVGFEVPSPYDPRHIEPTSVRYVDNLGATLPIGPTEFSIEGRTIWCTFRDAGEARRLALPNPDRPDKPSVFSIMARVEYASVSVPVDAGFIGTFQPSPP
ncbi:MAG: zf-HC2 domain-containing protein [Fimbriimonas ginsengisoli]|uniref:Zf-HC2 domain-containing protein n=1 Tax=Fimbriimonas ginsengisoli TaxID=1005039 RepID=A0A931PX31_FIMGI|nr:zf-HC2 domain-containing protein [Fimbriimonas ginsengisoli]